MKRREFVAASCFAGLAPLGIVAEASESSDTAKSDPAKKEYYELRLYHLDPGPKEEPFHDFLRDAAIPALNRIGIGPVGVFRMLEGDDPNVYVLLPHKSAESVVTATARLMSDAEYLKAGASLLDAPLSDPAYKRIESSLMLAFDGLPKLEVPSEKESRIFQLRIYESHSVKKGQKKIEMFNAGGEIAIFRRAGMPPVFFGETLIGAKLPNLTYMLGFDDEEALKRGWKNFLSDPGWDELKRNPVYKDTVSNITNMLLRPAACSQI